MAIPTIGIGAGGGTSGQILVLTDLLGLDASFRPKFVRRYLDVEGKSFEVSVSVHPAARFSVAMRLKRSNG